MKLDITKQSHFITITLAVLLIPLCLCILFAQIGKNTSTSTPIQQTTSLTPEQLIEAQQKQAEAEAKAGAELLKQQEEEAAKEALNQNIANKIEVTSMIIKKIDGYYRYFFDIRNSSDKDFNGSVEITLFTGNGVGITSGTYDTDDLNNGVLAEGLGMTRYMDARTGHTEEFGSYRYVEFSYSVKIDDKVYKVNEDMLTDNFEDLDY